MSYQNDLRSDGGKLAKLLLCIVFIVGFISELGALGANLAVFILELIFIVSFLLRKDLSLDWRLSLAGNKLIAAVLALWLIWVSVSFMHAVFTYEQQSSEQQAYEQKIALSFIRLVEYIGHIVFVIFLTRFFSLVNVNVPKLLLFIPLTAMLIGLNMLIAWNLHPENHSDILWLDTPPFYMNIRQAGFHCTVAILVLLPMLQMKSLHVMNNENAMHSFYKPSLLFFMLLCCTTFLFWTGGRASAIALYLTLLLWLVFLLIQRQNIKHLLAFLIGSVCLALVLSELLVVMPWNGLFSAAARSVGTESLDKFSSGRVEVWLFAWEQIQLFPWLGQSAESYFILDKSPTQFQPHNSILQFAMDWGIVGAILSFLLMFLAFIKGFIDYRKSMSVLAASGGLVIVLLIATSMLDGTLYHGQVSFYLALAYSLWLAKALPKSVDNGSAHL